MALASLRFLRESVEVAVLDERVEGTLAAGVFAYLAALIRLVEDGDWDPDIALAEGAAAVDFLRGVPRLAPRPTPPLEAVMPPRTRRAARELSGYLIRLYGAQPGLRISEADPLDGSPRVQIYAEGIEATRPPPDDGKTYGADSIDRWTPAFVSDVARLASRLVAIRSERYSPTGGLVPVDIHDGVAILETEFGRLFEGAVEVDVPWQELARAVAETLQVEDLLDGVESAQVKSKFAELRWYFKSIPKSIRGEVNVFVEAATVLSTVVCEKCGAPGEHRPGSWHQIRCDACQDAWERSRRLG